ncbi:MAG: protein kinase [Pyrinomonadaceae bacterium]
MEEKLLTIATGTRLGRYEIRSQLGVGGMGEVYLAEDTKLDRKVALKILPGEVAGNQDRMRRFVQEAKSAAALNHPNIAHIYEIEEAVGTHFIAMEYVEGQTLREKIHRDGTALVKLLKYFVQVADGLSKAHGAGIVHRDLKPDNIMITREGYAKILDFGLAKLIELPRQKPDREGGLEEEHLSEMATAVLQQHSMPGTVLGTAGYMSPEQARGKVREIDHRSDIFSFGCILFEAATGQKAFGGEDALDSLHKIVHAPTPQIAEVNPNAPAELQRIVRRCLAKDPDKRYQSIKEVAIELDELRQELKGASELHDSVHHTAGSAAATQSQPALAQGSSIATSIPAESISTRASSAEYIIRGVRRNKKILFAALAMIVLAGGTLAIYQYALKPKPALAHFERVKLTRITTEGNLQSVAVAPDGKYIAYTLLEGGKYSLWTKHLATDSRVQIVAPTPATIMTPYFFSHDGGYVFYGQRDEQNRTGALFQVAVLGGPPKKILTHINSAAGLSPDGKQIAFARYRPAVASEQYQVWLANADGTNERRLWGCTEPKWLGLNGVSWSPDGKLLTVDYGTEEEGDDHTTVGAIAVADGTFKVISAKRWNRVGRVAWFGDGGGMAMAARERGADNWQIWRLSYPGGEEQRLTNDLHSYGFTSLTLTADSRTLVALQVEGTAAVWIAPEGDARRARAITSRSSNGGFDWTPDGRLVFTSNAGGRPGIWVMNADGGEPKQLTEGGSLPQVSSDGRYIFHESERSKTKQVWRVDSDGSHPKQLTEGGSVETFALTPDGRWVIYSLYTPSIWKVPVDGGAPTKVADGQAFNLRVSPDGRLLAYTGLDPQTNSLRLTVLTLEGGASVKTFDLPVTATSLFHWLPDSRAMVYADNRGDVGNLWRLPLDGPSAQMTDFKSDHINFFAYSRDGKQLALSRGNITRDALMISDEEND